MKPMYLPLAAFGLCLLGMTAQAQKAPGTNKKLYCWDQNGQRICSDTLPQEAINQAREEFNATSGTRSGEVQRALSAEERAAAVVAEAQQRLDAAAEQTRRRTEQAMLTSYQSEDDLRRVFGERSGIIDNNIKTARFNVGSLRDGLVILLRSAGDRELAGQKVADKLAADIRQRHAELLWQQRLQASFEQQRRDLDVEIEQTLERYRALKGPGSTAPESTG